MKRPLSDSTHRTLLIISNENCMVIFFKFYFLSSLPFVLSFAIYIAVKMAHTGIVSINTLLVGVLIDRPFELYHFNWSDGQREINYQRNFYPNFV